MKHILDWYNENTPQNEDEYEKRMLDKLMPNYKLMGCYTPKKED